MNSLNESDSKPCLLPPHTKAVELVFQLSGNRIQFPKEEAVVRKRLPLMLYTASSSHLFTREFKSVDMNIQGYVTEILYLLKNTLHTL